ncbi:MAG TPA: protease modulator HflC [Arenimonas sp.]|tara:strand:- start:12769 stop:13641 length:873 start_codon:yes stop_codon:yes gene_type:complete
MNRFSVIIFAVIAALLAAMGSIYVVNESQTAIVLNLGRVVRADIQPGLHFKWPLVEEVRKFDQRILSLDDQPERYLTSEKKDVSVDFFVKWRIQDVATYYRAASGGSEEAARQRLTPIVKNALRNEINQRTLQEVVSAGRAELSGAFLKKVNESAQSLGVEVVDVRIKRINLPDDSNILTTVYSRMRTERTQVANQLRAEGVELSETIRSEADRQRVVTLAEAERDAQKLRGEGDARAAEIAAAAYGGDPEFYAFYRSLELYRNAMADGQTVLVLDPDSEFLRYMENSGR